MDSLSLTDSDPKIKTRNSDRLFFDRYCYSLKFYMLEVSSLRDYHKSDIELWQLLDRIEELLNIRERFDHYNIRYNSVFKSRGQYGKTHRNNLKDLAEVLYNNRHNIKFVITGSWAYVYSNDLEFLKQVSQLEYLRCTAFREIKVNRPKDTIGLRKPKHKFRIYFSDIWITPEQKQSIVSFLISQEDIRLSPALKSWCKSSYFWTQRSHFVDYDTESFPLALQLINPRVVRKKFQIVELNS